MTKDQLALVLERSESWPDEAREELMRLAPDIERRHGGLYTLNDGERADIREALAEAERGEVATEDDVRATFEQLRRS